MLGAEGVREGGLGSWISEQRQCAGRDPGLAGTGAILGGEEAGGRAEQDSGRTF